MLAKQQPKVLAQLRCPCIACLGEGYDAAGQVCVGCKGEEVFFLDIEEKYVEDVRDWVDGPAWDAVYDKIAANGAEVHEDAWQYEFKNEFHDGRRYELWFKIARYPVSKETAAAMNTLVRK